MSTVKNRQDVLERRSLFISEIRIRTKMQESLAVVGRRDDSAGHFPAAVQENINPQKRQFMRCVPERQ
jgi:hypothetical protein